MYSFERLEILKQLSRKEIIQIALNLNELRAERFVSLFKLNKEEIDLFKEKFKKNKRVLEAICYYQENNKDIYQKKFDLNKN